MIEVNVWKGLTKRDSTELDMLWTRNITEIMKEDSFKNGGKQMEKVCYHQLL